jgi:hypothetical protein
LGATLLYTIHSTTIKNTLFEDGEDANAFHAFNPTQIFLHLKNEIVIDPLWSVGQYTSYCIIM